MPKQKSAPMDVISGTLPNPGQAADAALTPGNPVDVPAEKPIKKALFTKGSGLRPGKQNAWLQEQAKQPGPKGAKARLALKLMAMRGAK